MFRTKTTLHKKMKKHCCSESPEFGEWMTDEGPEEDDEDTLAIMVGTDDSEA